MILRNRKTEFFFSRTDFLTRVAAAAAIIAAAAPLSIPLGPVPLSIQVFIVVLFSLLLPFTQATVAIGIYLILGLSGLPVFAGFKAGPAVLTGPTGGYLLGFLFCPLAASLLLEKTGRRTSWWQLAVAGLICLIPVYLSGLLWLIISLKLDFSKALLLGFYPFIGWDFLKVLVASKCASRLYSINIFQQ